MLLFIEWLQRMLDLEEKKFSGVQKQGHPCFLFCKIFNDVPTTFHDYHVCHNPPARKYCPDPSP